MWDWAGWGLLDEHLIIFYTMAFHFVDTSERALDILFSLFCLLLYDASVDNYPSAEDDSLEGRGGGRGTRLLTPLCGGTAALR